MSYKNHFNFFIEKNIISKQASKEYKINFYFMLLFDIILFFTTTTFFYVMLPFINLVLDWTIYDLILVYWLELLTWKILWSHNLRGWNNRLLNGELNNYITKPINPYFGATSQLMSWPNTLTGFFILFGSLFFMFTHQNYIYPFFGFLVFLFGVFMFILYFNFFYSLNFFIKDTNNYIYNLSRMPEGIVFDYTPKFFESYKFGFFFFLVPSAIIGFFTIEVLRGNFDYFNIFYLPILCLFFLLILGTYLLWKFGLKKYEAFG